MKRQLMTLITTLLLVTTIVAIVNIQVAFAKHDAKVYWMTSEGGVIVDHPNNSTIAFKQISYVDPVEVIFAVENTGLEGWDYITSVEVIIPQDEATGNARFRLVEGKASTESDMSATLPYWSTDIVEIDGRGWVRIWRFYTPNSTHGIPPDTAWYFSLTFDDGPGICSYDFSIWTDDMGVAPPKQKRSHTLKFVIDSTDPIVTASVTPTPIAGIVTGIIEPCGSHYFNITATAYDGTPHDTGLSEYEVWVNEVKITEGTINSAPGNFTSEVPWSLPAVKVPRTGMPDANITVTVKVWDGVGNEGQASITFKYEAPDVPQATATPSEGYASANTTIHNEATGLVHSNQTTYKAKTLGTLVTVTGSYFDPAISTHVRVYLPTYHSYFDEYGTYEVLVNTTTTRTDGTFTATFIFPKAPAGTYEIRVYSYPCNISIWFEVLPQIIFNPNEVIGPALIDVKATGFTAGTIDSWFFIVPDALQGANLHTQWNWHIDGNGTLMNLLTEFGQDCTPPQTVNTTLNWPYMQPGTYTVEIKHINGHYWDGTTKTWIPTPCHCHSNTITVRDWAGDILDAAQGAETAAQAAKTSADAAKTSADAAKTSADAATSSANTAGTNANAAKASADAAKVAAEGTEAAAESAKAAAEGLTMPVYLAVILSLIAAIAAAICTILVYRKIA